MVDINNASQFPPLFLDRNRLRLEAEREEVKARIVEGGTYGFGIWQLGEGVGFILQGRQFFKQNQGSTDFVSLFRQWGATNKQALYASGDTLYSGFPKAANFITSKIPTKKGLIQAVPTFSKWGESLLNTVTKNCPTLWKTVQWPLNKLTAVQRLMSSIVSKSATGILIAGKTSSQFALRRLPAIFSTLAALNNMWNNANDPRRSGVTKACDVAAEGLVGFLEGGVNLFTLGFLGFAVRDIFSYISSQVDGAKIALSPDGEFYRSLAEKPFGLFWDWCYGNFDTPSLEKKEERSSIQASTPLPIPTVPVTAPIAPTTLIPLALPPPSLPVLPATEQERQGQKEN